MSLTETQKRKIEEEEKYRSEIRGKFSKDLEYISDKNKIAAALLAIVFGGIGLHKFYLGKPIWGIIYILFCWTFIPGILGIIEGIYYLLMSEKSFRLKYS